jgi:transglutaminase-like putative cysteine protease
VRRTLVMTTPFGVLIAVLAGSLAAIGSSSRGATRTFEFTYSVAVQDIPAGARQLSIWIPVPKTDRHQQVLDLEVKAPLEYEITHEKRYGNQLLHLAAAAPLPKSIELQLEAVVARRAYNVFTGKARDRNSDPPAPRDLEPDALVPTDGAIAAAARDATKHARTPLEKARAIYDYVTSTMRYDKSGQGWGRGDAVYACDARRGNCTDFHSLIIGMARACDIPARFVMGFPLPEGRKEGEISGYHCWAEMYVDFFFGGLDANRVEFTRGRDLDLEPPASDQLNFFVYPRVEVDGLVHTGVTQSFFFAEIKT